MRAIVIGAGDVGYDVARMLSLQSHDVTVIDMDADKVNAIRDALDVLAIRGSGTSARVLHEARVRDAGLLVAVTDVDEVNLIASMLAERVTENGIVTIARVRSDEFTGARSVLGMADFGLDLIIHPEESTAAEAVALLRRASATDIIEFADGRLQLVGIRIEPEDPIIGRTLQEIATANDHLTFRIMGIARGARTIVPRGSERIQKGDQVFVLVESGQVAQVVHVLGKSGARLEYVMILGGSKVAGRIAAQLSDQKGRHKLHVKLIEPDRARAERLAEELEGVLVIHGDPTDMDLLVVEGVGEMDAFVAVTDDEESNLVSCLMAKHLGVRKTVAMLSKSAYIPISQSIGLDAAVSQKLAISREVLRFLRGKHVTSVATILGLDAEIIELVAETEAPVTRAPLMEQKIPKGILIAAAVSPSGRVEIATGATQITSGDRVIVFVTPDKVEEVEAYFGHVAVVT